MEKNSPELWQPFLPIPTLDGHKYDRGHAIILGASSLTGATRLAASACSRMGAGLTTVISNQQASVYRLALPADIMVRETISNDIKKVSVLLAGPGGTNEEQRKLIANNPWQCPLVLDANAIPVDGNFAGLNDNCVLTPHEGEFEKAFGNFGKYRIEKTLEAAKLSGAIILLKGMQSIIASPDGRVVANDHASPWLAKAGTGDVLAGMITGMIAQKMEPFWATCAAVWMHGEAGRRIGPGLIASDIENELRFILKKIMEV
ncbi:MAG: NAD(P)H-hydrate dehydratase [Salaquimonas sp.]